jgi:hypothetical protein
MWSSAQIGIICVKEISEARFESVPVFDVKAVGKPRDHFLYFESILEAHV